MTDIDAHASSSPSTERAPSGLQPRLETCDMCCAQAVIRTRTADGGYLEWCSHHYHRLEPALLASGAVITADLRPRRP